MIFCIVKQTVHMLVCFYKAVFIILFKVIKSCGILLFGLCTVIYEKTKEEIKKKEEEKLLKIASQSDIFET